MPEQLPLADDLAPETIERSAVISPDHRYRYRLGRRWGHGSTCAFIGLNPSTADHVLDDPTIRKCITLARAWGHDAIEVVNLFGFRTAYPKELRRAHRDSGSLERVVGAENDDHVRYVLSRAARIVAAWGRHEIAGETHRDRRVCAIALEHGDVFCLGHTQNGEPRHPLYMPNDTEPQLWLRRSA